MQNNRQELATMRRQLQQDPFAPIEPGLFREKMAPPQQAEQKSTQARHPNPLIQENIERMLRLEKPLSIDQPSKDIKSNIQKRTIHEIKYERFMNYFK